MSYRPDVPSRSENTWLSLGAAAGGPWRLAAASGAVVGAANFGLQLLSGQISVGGPITTGLIVLFMVGGIGTYLRRDRIQTWVRNNTWRVAVVPGIGAAATTFPVLWLLSGAGFFGGAFMAAMFGAGVFLSVGLVGMLIKAMRSG
jgi:hypothetical protein